MDDEIIEISVNDEYTEAGEDSEQSRSPADDGKHLVKKKRRERLVRKGRLKQERFRAFMRFFLYFSYSLRFKMPRMVYGQISF